MTTSNNGTTLTREQLLNKAEKLKCETVEVDGWGEVMLRGVSHIQAIRRANSYFGKDGKLSANYAEYQAVHRIIDHVMTDETTKMFKEEDAATLAEADQTFLDPILTAIAKFNGDIDVLDEAMSGNE